MFQHFSRKLGAQLAAALASDAPRKVVTLFGARQTGKTTLMQECFAGLAGRKEFLNGDFDTDCVLLEPTREALARLAVNLDYLFVDEAQNVPDIGLVLKLLHDTYPTLRIVASGSASFDLRASTGEPLTGRQRVLEMFPLSLGELSPRPTTLSTLIEHGLIYGAYPEVVTLGTPEEKQRHLLQLVSDYLLKDIFALVETNRERLRDLLRLLAFQIGSEVSFGEIAGALRCDIKTVERYLHFLEGAHVVLRVGAFARNLRKEISKSRKIYFADLGIRNALINAFAPPPLRDDMGALWENYAVIERHKKLSLEGVNHSAYFWRTYDQQEIDYVEESGGQIRAYEFKWNSGGRGRSGGGTGNTAGAGPATVRVKTPKAWRVAYPQSGEVSVVTPNDALDFLV